uniref:WW domain-containing protein n=1 Tax=Knipowitschia caucasica TaxID=637954 RepID=A0AAV2L3Z2_KNICA
MAAELQHDWISCLPSTWSYGVTRDGRLFFVNEEAKSTTWLHPVSGEALITGHRKTPGERSSSLINFPSYLCCVGCVPVSHPRGPSASPRPPREYDSPVLELSGVTD